MVGKGEGRKGEEREGREREGRGEEGTAPLTQIPGSAPGMDHFSATTLDLTVTLTTARAWKSRKFVACTPVTFIDTPHLFTITTEPSVHSSSSRHAMLVVRDGFT